MLANRPHWARTERLQCHDFAAGLPKAL